LFYCPDSRTRNLSEQGAEIMPLEIVVGAVVGAAAASVVNSPPVRQKVRRGAVYGLAGLLVAYDHVAALAQGAVKGARRVVRTQADTDQAAETAPAAAPPATLPAPATTSTAPPG
jgi:hypothetical protein